MKKKLTECIIPISSLKNGENGFRFALNGDIFTENQYDDIHNAALTASVSFNKNSSIMTFHFDIEGTVNVTCDRCGDDFDMPLSVKRQLIVKTECHEHQEEDDMVCLSGDESDFDVAPYIYQYVVLSLPMQRIHLADQNGKSSCNSETIAKLNNIHVETSNDEEYVNMHFPPDKEKSLKSKLKNNN